MGRDIVEVVRGRRVLQMDGSALEREVTRYDRVVIDLGTGDGRWVYRLARVYPHGFASALMLTSKGYAKPHFVRGAS